MNNIKIWSKVKIKKVVRNLNLSIMKLLVSYKLSKKVVSKIKLIIKMLSVI